MRRRGSSWPRRRRDAQRARRRRRPAIRRAPRVPLLRAADASACAARGRRDARRRDRRSGYPTSARSPTTSRILWRTNSSSKRSAFSTPVSPMTIAFSSEPPSARPFWRSHSTSLRKPKVRAAAMLSAKLCLGDAFRARLVAQQRMVEADGVADLEVIRRVDRDALVAVAICTGRRIFRYLRGADRLLDARFLDQIQERRRAAVHDRHFAVIELDDDVVDADADERGEQVLDRFDRRAVAAEHRRILNARDIARPSPESRRPGRCGGKRCRCRPPRA